MRLGYAHRGIEKGTEARNWTQDLYLLERICGICSHVHALAYSLGVEQLAGVTVPPRAQAIRTLVAEMERIHSHFLWLGVAAHEAGFDTLFMYSWRDREAIMDALETLTGNRVNYSANLLGGVKCDVTPEIADLIRRAVDQLEARTQHYLDVITTDELWMQRTVGVGMATAEQADKLGLMGPTARASGVMRDIRVDRALCRLRRFPGSADNRHGGRPARALRRAPQGTLRKLPPDPRTARPHAGRRSAGADAAPHQSRRDDQPGRSAARRTVLLHQEQRDGDMPERVKVRTPTHLQSRVGAVAGGRSPTGGRPDDPCRHRSVLLLQ